jgi:hypothetical protein
MTAGTTIGTMTMTNDMKDLRGAAGKSAAAGLLLVPISLSSLSWRLSLRF